MTGNDLVYERLQWKNNKILASVKMYTLNHIYDYKWTVTSLKNKWKKLEYTKIRK